MPDGLSYQVAVPEPNGCLETVEPRRQPVARSYDRTPPSGAVVSNEHLRVRARGKAVDVDLTVNALRRIFDSPQRNVLRRISQLVLAAPDVNRVWMDLEFVPVLEYVRIPTTIYVSSPDAWIGLSELIHQHARVGSFWDHSIYLQNLLTTVDLSAVEDAGHSVVFSPRVIYDLYFVLEQELPPEQRPWLWKTELMKGTYWHLLPQLIRP